MEIISVGVRGVDIKEQGPSIVDFCETHLLNYLGGSRSGRGCPLFEAELSFRVLYNQLFQIHGQILEYITHAEDITEAFKYANPEVVMKPHDKYLKICDINAAKLKITAEAHILSALTAADCIIDHTIDYSLKLFKKTQGRFLNELNTCCVQSKDYLQHCEKVVGKVYQSETGKSVSGIVELINWRNSRVHQSHFYLTIDNKKKCIVYSTSMNDFIGKPEHKFSSQGLKF
jgi:hypothetical protein